MIYRISIIAIVAFWLVMTGLLVRLEIAPEKSTVLNVPVAHVLQLMFAHAQQSVLNINEGSLPIGTLLLQPSAEADQRSLWFSGNLWLRLPMVAKQRISWDGTVQMDRALKMRSTVFELNLFDPPAHLALSVREPARVLHYEIRQGRAKPSAADISLDARGLSAIAGQLGLDPNALAAIPKNTTPPQVTAKQTEHIFHGEKISVFQISVRQGDSSFAEIYVSQLGQVLEATTPLGYTLTAHD